MAKCFRGIFPILLSLMISPLIASAYDSVVEKFEKTFDVQGRTRLEVRNSDGQTFIQSGTAEDEVRVEVTKEVFHAKNEAEAKKEADRVQVRLEQMGNAIEISTIYPKRNFDLGGRPDVRVHFQIIAPAGTDLTARTSDGPLEVSGLQGSQEILSADGDVTLTNCTGDINVSAGDGDIHVKQCSGGLRLALRDGDINADNLSGQLFLKSSDGDVFLNGFQGKLDALSRDGNVQLNGTFTSLSAKTSDGDIDITVGSGSVMEQDWSLRSRDGDLQLRLPDSFSAELAVRCRDGRIHTTIPITIQGSLSENEVAGKINSGGYLLDIQTSDGNIDIVR